MNYPLSWVFCYLVHGTTIRHLYHVFVGLLVQYYAFGLGIWHSFLMTGVAYLLMIVLPRMKQARYVMWWSLGYLCYNHLYRMIYHFGEFNMDISSFTMLHACKLSALAYCYLDGVKEDKDMNDSQKSKCIKNLPTPLELAGYTFFVPNCALGVFFEFRDYKNLIEKKEHYENIPNTILPSLRTLFEALLCMGFFLFATNYFGVDFIYSPEYAECNFFYKVFYYYVAMTVKRFFYYGPFKFTTGAFIASGLGFNGNKAKDRWGRVVGVYVIDIETANSVTVMLRAWNHQVHLWLKFYIQERIVQPGRSATFLESMSTFVVSAFWHGFYPSYYIMFVMAAVLNEINKDVYKSFYLWHKYIPVYGVRYMLAHIFSMINMNYFGILFQALTVERTWWYLSQTYFFIPISLVVTLGFIRSIGLVRMSKKMHEKATAKAEKKD